MTTPFYGDNYEIIDGAKVYFFTVDPPRCDKTDKTVKTEKTEQISAAEAVAYFCYGMVYPLAKAISGISRAVKGRRTA